MRIFAAASSVIILTALEATADAWSTVSCRHQAHDPTARMVGLISSKILNEPLVVQLSVSPIRGRDKVSS